MHLYHQPMDSLLIKSPVMMCDIGMMINCNNYIADTCTVLSTCEWACQLNFKHEDSRMNDE